MLTDLDVNLHSVCQRHRNMRSGCVVRELYQKVDIPINSVSEFHTQFQLSLISNQAYATLRGWGGGSSGRDRQCHGWCEE